MKLGERLREWFFANPLAWLLLAALLFAAYGNWQLGKQLTHVCELAIDPEEVVIIHEHPRTEREELNKICTERLSDADTDDRD